MEPVASPCTGICTLGAEDICIGCGRTIDDIAEWSRAPAARQRAIVEAAASRMSRRKLGFRDLTDQTRSG